MNKIKYLRKAVKISLLSSFIIVIVVTIFTLSSSAQPYPLPSWNETTSKQSIIKFVNDVTKEGSPQFVPVSDRIAVFDNDGTLWSEQPFYNQLAFAIDRVKALAPQHPEWKQEQPFKAVLEDDNKTLAASGLEGLVKLVMATHAGNTTEEFQSLVKEWIATAKHPRFNQLYTELAYLPMIELIAYLQNNGFKTYIVSGGGVEFMRPWTEKIYNIPPDQVIGSSIKTKFEIKDGKPVLLRLPEVNFIDDKEGKPAGINQFIGRRPIAAFGNSDGDLQMLQWTAAGKNPSLMTIVHHTDAEREWAYDRSAIVGRLDKALDEATEKGWLLVDMKKDWKQIFAFEK